MIEISHIQKINRYGLSAQFNSRNREFYFSAPIYIGQSETLVKRCFTLKGNQYVMQGSSAQVIITESGIKFLTVFGSMRIYWEEKQQFSLCDNGRFLRSEKMSVYPTFNGALIRQVNDGEVTLFFESTN